VTCQYPQNRRQRAGTLPLVKLLGICHVRRPTLPGRTEVPDRRSVPLRRMSQHALWQNLAPQELFQFGAPASPSPAPSEVNSFDRCQWDLPDPAVARLSVCMHTSGRQQVVWDASRCCTRWVSHHSSAMTTCSAWTHIHARLGHAGPGRKQ
jgi:hypothetical protein